MGRIGDGRVAWLLDADTGEGRVMGNFAARSQYVQNCPNLTCHSFHCSADASRLYLMLLRNSTSMTWISVTDMPDTSAQVLFVYVLSSRTVLPSVSVKIKNSEH